MSNYTPIPKPYPLVVLVGPTASGKSELAVLLAKKFNGEIISCDSRQIYKGMDLGSGKVEGRWLPSPLARGEVSSAAERQRGRIKKRKVFIYKTIPHYCIDYVNPKNQYSSANFQRDATQAIADILKRGKLPILCGGTAHWVDAVVFNQQLPDVKPNLKLRAKLEKKSVAQLFRQLQKLDPVRAQTIDSKNPHRLIRALEIVLTTGKPVPTLGGTPSELGESKGNPTTLSPYNPIWLGIKTIQSSLYKKIDTRLKERLDDGMLKEVKKLHTTGLSWKKLESFGLEYKYLSLYLQKKLGYNEMLTQLSFAVKHYSKRQLTWWKRNKEIKWVKVDDDKLFSYIEKKLK